MSVLMVLDVPGGTLEQYDRVNEIMGKSGDEDAPDGLVHHAAGSEGGSLVVTDLWESEEALGRFVEGKLGAALAEAGIPPDTKPRVLPVHNALEGAGGEPGVIMLIEIDDLDTAGYDQMASNMDAHTGGQRPWVSHVAAKTEGGGILVVDVWESAEAFGAFAEQQIAPASAAAGLGPIEPRLVPVHNRFRGRAAAVAGSGQAAS
jgi:heme-degrading monooxygenase HmoA